MEKKKLEWVKPTLVDLSESPEDTSPTTCVVSSAEPQSK